MVNLKTFLWSQFKFIVQLFVLNKKEEERLRASIRRESHQRRMREKAHQRGMDRGYLEGEFEEEEEDEEEVSIAAIKKQFKPGAKKGEQKKYDTFVNKYVLKQTPVLTETWEKITSKLLTSDIEN